MTFCPVEPESRAFTDASLAELRASRWRAQGWLRFVVRTGVRSAQQVVAHPQAAAEVTLIHLGFLALGQDRVRARRWVATSWVMTITHLGLLERRRSIGWPNVVSLARANLPVTGRCFGRWLGVTAVVSDAVDGILARRDGPTMFGFYADALADAVFWTWFGRPGIPTAWSGRPRSRPGPRVSIQKGEMVQSPRPVVIRPAAALQVVLALRTLGAKAWE
jgi:hypothetical protein